MNLPTGYIYMDIDIYYSEFHVPCNFEVKKIKNVYIHIDIYIYLRAA